MLLSNNRARALAGILAFSLTAFVHSAAGAGDSLHIPVPINTIFAGQEILADMLRERKVPETYAAQRPVIRKGSDLVGKVAKRTLPAAQPIMVYQIDEPNVVIANQPTIMKYQRNGLIISTEVIPLRSAKAGDVVRVRNVYSRQTLFGTAMKGGFIVALER